MASGRCAPRDQVIVSAGGDLAADTTIDASISGSDVAGKRHTYPEVPPRVEYALTEKGNDLAPLIEDMRAYGKRWLADERAADPAVA